MARKHPVCCRCGGEIDPARFEGCEKYFLTEGGPMCLDCFREDAEEYIRTNTEDYAALVGVPVVFTR